MTFNSLISFIGALFCGGLAVFVLFRDRHSFIETNMLVKFFAEKVLDLIPNYWPIEQ